MIHDTTPQDLVTRFTCFLLCTHSVQAPVRKKGPTGLAGRREAHTRRERGT
jgi:hypothetical protein